MREAEHDGFKVLDTFQIEQLSNHIKELSSDNMAGRKFSSAGSLLAQNYIINALKTSKVLPFQGNYQHTFIQNNLFNSKEGSNIIGFVKGTLFPDSFIVISAHYDHLGQKGSKIYNGADDNASGTAAVLTFAQYIAQTPFNHSIIFLFTDGEEVNLLGAKAFIKQNKSILPKVRINVNIDMIAGSKQTKKLHYIDNNLEKAFTKSNIQLFHNISAHNKFKAKRGFKRNIHSANTKTNWFNVSDHAVFNKIDIPFVYFGVGEHKNYHTDKDNYNNINHSFYVEACQSILHYLQFLDSHIHSTQKKLTN